MFLIENNHYVGVLERVSSSSSYSRVVFKRSFHVLRSSRSLPETRRVARCTDEEPTEQTSASKHLNVRDIDELVAIWDGVVLVLVFGCS